MVSGWHCVLVFFLIAAAPQVIVPDSKLIQHMNASNMVRRKIALSLALLILTQILIMPRYVVY